jgi:hypothetical protein
MISVKKYKDNNKLEYERGLFAKNNPQKASISIFVDPTVFFRTDNLLKRTPSVISVNLPFS